MNERIIKTLTVGSNIGVILSTILLGVIVLRNLTVGGAPKAAVQNQASAVQRRVPQPGEKVSLSGVDWEKNGNTVLFVVSTKCHFCKESAPFYQRAIQEAKSVKDMKLVAVLPQDIDEGKKYLSDLGVAVHDVRQSSPSSVGTSGFPTLMFVDKTGTMKKAWVGKLTPDKESEVLNQIKCPTCN